MSGVILLVFIGFPAVRGIQSREVLNNTWWRYGNVPIWYWLFIIFGVLAAYYVGITWYEIDLELFGLDFQLPEQVLRQGNPARIDVVFGTILIIVLLEAVRRTLGPIVPIIIIIFITYAVFGMQMPLQILKHPGVSWDLFINSMYFPEEGIFGVTLWIVSTVVFHFVLFGIIAQRMGLGQFFVDVATVFAGRYTSRQSVPRIGSSLHFVGWPSAGPISSTHAFSNATTSSPICSGRCPDGWPAVPFPKNAPPPFEETRSLIHCRPLCWFKQE